MLLLVCPLHFNLPGLVGPARSLCLARVRLYCYKECFKVNKDAKFKSDMLKTNEDVARQIKYSENLQTFVWLELSQWCHHRINVCKIWLEQYLHSLWTYHIYTWSVTDLYQNLKKKNRGSKDLFNIVLCEDEGVFRISLFQTSISISTHCIASPVEFFISQCFVAQ